MVKVQGPFKSLSNDELNQVLDLWNNSYPIGICYEDLAQLESFFAPLGNKRHYLIKNQSVIEAWIVTFDREDARWFSIIVSPSNKKKGLGKFLLKHVIDKEPKLNGWVSDHNNDVKRDGTPYESPLGFYLKLGFNVDNKMRYEKPGISCVRIFYK